MPLSSQPQPPLRALPAVLIAASFASGIGAAMLLEGYGSLSPAFALAVAGLLLTVGRRLRQAGLLLIVASAGMADYYLTTKPIDISPEIHSYAGDVIAASDKGSHAAITVHVDQMDGRELSPFNVRLYLDQELNDMTDGKRVTFRCSLRKPSMSHTLPDEVSQADILARAGIIATSYITAKDITCVTNASGLKAMMARQRNHIVETLYRTSLSPRSKQFLATILLGDRDAMGDESREAFARAGLSHIMALSGMHVAIIAAFIFWLLSPTLLIVSRHYRSIAIIVLIWGYAFLTGLNAPVVRAGIMTTLVFAADLLQRRTFAINSLMVAALVILVFTPTALADIGFQLSFLAVGSIISFAEYLNPASSAHNKLVRMAGASVGMTMAAMLSTALVSALHFHTVPVLFLLSNIITGPVLVPVIIAGGIIVILASHLGISYGVIAGIVDLAVDGVEATAGFISGCRWATVEVWALSGTTVALLLITLTLIAIYLRRPAMSRKMIPASIFTAILTLISAFATGTLPERDPAGKWYYVPSHDYADFIFVSGDTLYLISDAPASTIGSRINSMRSRLHEYMGRRNIRSLEEAPEKIYREGIIRNRKRLIAASTRFTFIGNESVGRSDSIFCTDILVVEKGFRGEIMKVLEDIKPSEVILSPALNPRLRRRYAGELSAAGIHYVDGAAVE